MEHSNNEITFNPDIETHASAVGDGYGAAPGIEGTGMETLEVELGMGLKDQTSGPAIRLDSYESAILRRLASWNRG